MPWAEGLAQKAEQEAAAEIARMESQWEQLWGSKDDPETQAAIDRTVAFLQSQTSTEDE